MAQSTGAKVRGGAKATTDHDEIRRWVEAHGGKPAVVKRTARGNQPGILRIDFPGFSGEQSLEPLEWDEWFERFDGANLAFLYQDETGSGRASRFNKLVARESVEEGGRTRASRGRAAKRPTARRGASAKKAAPRAGRGRTQPAKRAGRTSTGGKAQSGAGTRKASTRAKSSSGRSTTSRSKKAGTKRGAARGATKRRGRSTRQ